ncbi:hypothetical protein [Streptomyces sp. enrichment culture]|uniref:hypothetical protein n=1 Tax=Streptomyces sp. enrichment culture TaxID=1795815 RepID=UPI003F54783C
MTETQSPHAASEGTWALPLLVLIPLTVLRMFADPSAGPWPVLGWCLIALAVLLLAAGWATAFRHGSRRRGAWGTCLLVHAALVWQTVLLLRQ